MHDMLKRGIVRGAEMVSAWADLLDRINVFPVADGDTGRNLKVSLTPLLQIEAARGDLTRRLLVSARGNSGNIASRFLTGFLEAEDERSIAQAVDHGRVLAWKALSNPRKGTMLTVFDALHGIYRGEKNVFHTEKTVEKIINLLEEAVRSTPRHLEKLRSAGVVDAGALGMFIFFDGFYRGLIGLEEDYKSVTERFGEMLIINSGFAEKGEDGFCIDTVLRIESRTDRTMDEINGSGESVIIIPEKEYVKVHLHAKDRDEARRRLESLGSVVEWSSDDIDSQIRSFRIKDRKGPIHVMTDAAGSLTPEDARLAGITLLESYITLEDRSLPETRFSPDELYRMMRNGARATTSQASVFERHQSYASSLNQHGRVIYLTVGSVYTGNYRVALEWKETHDREGRFTVLDTGAASGRLGLLAVAIARFAEDADSPEEVIDYAGRSVDRCGEYLFIDKLHYLAAGGRLSKTGAFFGDMLHFKPVITPSPAGAKKVAVVRKGDDQIRFALDRLGEVRETGGTPIIMLQFTDNRDWVMAEMEPHVRSLMPDAEIILQPLSLTTGVHAGPGTWAVAFITQ